MKTLPKIASVLFCLFSVTLVLHAQVPQIINYQGRVLVGTTNFNSPPQGQFKFALLNSTGTTAYWSNDGSLSLTPGAITPSSQPTAAVSLPVTNGLYSVLLGDTSIANMTVALPSSAFTNSDVRLRVWFNDGTHGSQLLTPDQRIAAVGYTFMADNIKDNAITTAKIATGAVGSSQLGSNLTLGGTTTGTFNGSGAALTSISATNITTGTLPQAQLPATVALRTGGNNFTGIQNITGDFGMEKIQAANSNNSAFMEFDTSTGGSRGIIGVDGNGFSGATNQFTIGSWTNTPLALYTNQVRRMTILSTGNVGIGIDTPTATLDVAGAINIPATTSATNGVIQMAGTPIISAEGTQNIFLGNGAGNFTLTGTQNTATGASSLAAITTGTNNTAAGFEALLSNTTGGSNTAVGWQALRNSTVPGNTALGAQALAANTTGGNNTAIGVTAALSNTTGSGNTATGYQALAANTTGGNNTATGFMAAISNTTGARNTATGVEASRLNMVGNDNTAMGWQALRNSTADHNTAFGSQAALSNTNGFDNTAAGFKALTNNTTGSGNTANGAGALATNLVANDNTAVGVNALNQNTGYSNTAIGAHALELNTTGGFCNFQCINIVGNTAIGTYALSSNTTGSSNTAIGHGALLFVNGNGNIGIGYFAGENLVGGSNNIYIANNGGTSTESGVIRIGSENQTATVIAAINGVNLSPSGTAVFVNSNGQLGTVNSSRRFKTDIKPMDHASDVLLSLKPVTFHYKPEIDAKGIAQFGLIAEEVAEVSPDLVIRNEKGEIQTVRYEQVNAMLLNEFLKQHKQIAQMKKEERSQLAALRNENANLRKDLAVLIARDKERDARLTRLEISMPATQPVANTIASSKAGEQ